MHLIALRKKEMSKKSAVLPRNADYQRALHNQATLLRVCNRAMESHTNEENVSRKFCSEKRSAFSRQAAASKSFCSKRRIASFSELTVGSAKNTPVEPSITVSRAAPCPSAITGVPQD